MSIIGPLPSSVNNNNKVGSIERAVSGEIDVKLFMFKNGRKLQTSEGNDDLSSFMRGFEVYESLTQACMEMRLILEDSGGILQTMTGSEEFALSIKSSIIDRTYFPQ